eukprot:gi/632985877/ref/XP_007909926.1/ PREDICTED: mucin-6-like [Callorhinchus milii]
MSARAAAAQGNDTKCAISTCYLMRPDSEVTCPKPPDAPSTAVCTTWGSGHFRTFDKKNYYINLNCTYELASDCMDFIKRFSIRFRRKGVHIELIDMRIFSTSITVQNGNISVNEEKLFNRKFDNKDIAIRPFGCSTKLNGKQQGLDLTVIWSSEYLAIQLGCLHRNTTCGLCGDYNGYPDHNEMFGEVFKDTPESRKLEKSHILPICRLSRKHGSDRLPENGTLEAVFQSCGHRGTETCLTKIIYAKDQDDVLEVVRIKEQKRSCYSAWCNHRPPNSGKEIDEHIYGIRIYRESSTHLQVHTNFGLQIQIQFCSPFQVHVYVDQTFCHTTHGLCGNFNGDSNDDFMSSMAISEATASLFADSWKVMANCRHSCDEDYEPCSLSELKYVFARTHCSILMNRFSIFRRCHHVVNPRDYYERCKYETCNYEKVNDFMCNSLGSYARACLLKGVILNGWREQVEGCSIHCFQNQIFSYNSRACHRTCVSLSHPDLECNSTDIPVDGCNCLENLYLDYDEKCVPEAECSCFLPNATAVLPHHQISLNGRICVDGQEDDSGAAYAPICQILATESQCLSSKCHNLLSPRK